MWNQPLHPLAIDRVDGHAVQRVRGFHPGFGQGRVRMDGFGVVDAMKEALRLFKKTWGENAVGSLSIGLVFFAVGAVGFLLVLATLLLGNPVVFLAAGALFIVLVAVLAILATAMQGIFVVALYTYAKTGRVPAAFDRELVENAFAPQAKSYVGTI